MAASTHDVWVQALTNAGIAHVNNQWQQQFLNQEQAYNTQMWEKTNEYNTPQAQAERYREAGMNPYLMMAPGNGGSASTVTSPTLGAHPMAPMTGLPEAKANDRNYRLNKIQTTLQGAQTLSDQITDLNSILNMEAQRTNLVSDARLKDSQAALNYATIPGIPYDNQIKQHNATAAGYNAGISKQNERVAKVQADLQEGYGQKMMEQNYRKEQAATNELELKNMVLQKQIPYIDEQTQVQLAIMKQNLANLAQDYEKGIITKELLQKQVDIEGEKFVQLCREGELRKFTPDEIQTLKNNYLTIQEATAWQANQNALYGGNSKAGQMLGDGVRIVVNGFNQVVSSVRGKSYGPRRYYNPNTQD